MYKHTKALFFVVYFLCGCLLFGSGQFFYNKNISANLSENSQIQQASIKLPIIMYHSIANGTPNKFKISPRKLSDDFEYIKEHEMHPVFLSQVVDFVERDVALPSNPIVLSFDDGYRNIFQNVLEIIKEYNFKIVISVIAKATDAHIDAEFPANAHMNYTQIQTMLDTGLVELASHTYDMHGSSPRLGIRKLRGESDENYLNKLSTDDINFKNSIFKNLNLSPKAFTYPYGKYNNIAKQYLKNNGYNIAMTCDHDINIINKNTDLMTLKRFNRPPQPSSKQFFDAIDYIGRDDGKSSMGKVLKYSWWK